MSAYRFCRSDDIPLLVQAYNACYRAHDPAIADWTVEDFKRAVRRVDLWTSSCMVAQEGRQTVGVLLAAKRKTANLIYRVGVRPGFQRRGHGRHMLESLGAKLAILGPRTMLAEVPRDDIATCRFIEAAGYRAQRTLVDFTRSPSPAPPPSPLLVPVTLADLAPSGALWGQAPRCWSRGDEALRRATQARGWAIAGERVEAYLLYHDVAGRAREILTFGAAERERAPALLEPLFRQSCGGTDLPLMVRRVAPQEIGFDLLEAWGFERGPSFVEYGRQAQAA